MKAKPPGKHHAKALHQPPKELREAEAMKPRERRKVRNFHLKPADRQW